jgi:hypothetical protein
VDRDRRAPEKTACYRLLARWALVQMCVPVTGALFPGNSTTSHSKAGGPGFTTYVPLTLHKGTLL